MQNSLFIVRGAKSATLHTFATIEAAAAAAAHFNHEFSALAPYSVTEYRAVTEHALEVEVVRASA